MAIRPPAAIDPATLRDRSELLVARQLYEPLLRFDPETLELKSGIARSWDVLDGGSRFVFHLRPDARFHDGHPVTAQDAAFALSRLVRRETGSELSFLLEAVAGFAAVRAGEAAELEGVRALDEVTLEVRIATPWVDFPYVLSHPATAPVPKQGLALDPVGFARKPAGSGAYRVAKPWKPGGDLVLEATPGSRGTPRVRFVAIADPDGGWADLQAGRVDIAEVPPGKLAEARNRYGTAGFSPVAAGVYLGFNLKGPKLADLAVRRAVSLAIDRTAIADQVYEEVLVPATSIVPVGIPGRNEMACGPLCKHDPDGARALLAQAPAGPVTIAFDYPAGATQDALAAAIEHNLADVGIQLQPRPHPLPEFLDLLEAEGQESFRILWVAEYPLADWFLTPLFAPGARDNHTGYAAPEVGDLLARARSAPGREERLRLYREAEARVMQDLPVVPIGFFRNHYAAGPGVRGLSVDQLGAFDIDRLTLRAP